MSVIVFGELLHGFQFGAREQWNRGKLAEFIQSPGVELVPIGQSVAQRYGTLKTQRRRLGRPIPTNDIWIAATAIERDYAVHSYDAHFRAVPGLRVVTTPSDLNES
jgi:tRNA(fMet)-specific endonuclease VapC